MDSFYDAPRRAPLPTQVEKFLPAPVVPEVSIFCSSKTHANKCLSYNSWKQQHKRNDNSCGYGEKIHQTNYVDLQNTSQLLKKQVRFESPVLQQNANKMDKTESCKSNPVIISKPFESCTKSNPQILNGTPFEQIYLSNVPNRKLDLSLIDLSNKMKERSNDLVEKQHEAGQISLLKTKITETVEECTTCDKENMLPKTYKEFLDTQKKVKENVNDSITDIFNYRRDFNSKNLAAKNNYEKRDFNCENSFSQRIVKDNVFNPNLRGSSDTNCIIPCTSNKFTGKQQTPFYENKLYPDIRKQTFEIVDENERISKQKCDRDIQTSTSPHTLETKSSGTSRNDPEPSNRDLLKIIAQQNEQLLILQKQVAVLLNRDGQHQPKQIEASSSPCQRMNYLGETCATSTRNENFRNPLLDVNNTPRKQRAVSKFSIDLMTSFEVAIRPQPNKQNFFNHEPKIQEITETESDVRGCSSTVDKYEKTLVDTSLNLQDPVKVRETCPSPEPTININMNDYDSSDDEASASEIGATFYHNLMGQVNDILRKAQVQTKDFGQGQNCTDKFQNETMNRVKEATLKHLKNIGVTIGQMEETGRVSSSHDSNDYTPTEISFAVKQLLLKYLPDEQLAKITCKAPQAAPLNKNGKPGIISSRPEFSFASVEYMKKYNLISNKDNKPKNIVGVQKAPSSQKPEGPKILDITALKMQPKLL